MIGCRGLAWLLLSAGCLVCHVGTDAVEADNQLEDVLLFTVATNETDGFRRYLRSAEVYGLKENLRVLGLGQEWKGGNVKRWAGGGYKVNLYKEALKEYENDDDRIILVTDSYDVIFLAGLSDILEKFKATGARILFSAEGSCWPNRSLASKYPPVTRGKRFLNSGAFIGYASDIYSIMSRDEIGDEDDDQLFYTMAYLDEGLRAKHKIKLDHKSEIFQNLYGAVADVELRFKGQESYLQNTVYNTVPLVLHGNGFSKLVLNSLGNYLAQAWSPEKGCLACWEGTIELDADKHESYPVVVVAIFIERPTPFLEASLKAIYQQTYPKSRLHLFIHNNEPFHEKVVEKFFQKYSKEYRSSKQVIPSDGINEVEARNLAMDFCLLKECSALFSVDSVAHLDNEHTLKLLVEQQRDIVAPMLVRPYKAWSNFWGAITDDGFYARSFDYMEIVKNERRGLWNVPFVCNCYLVNASLIKNPKTRPTYSAAELDTEMAFAYGNRERSIFMHVSNRLDFGHLINPENYDTALANPDFYQIMDNKLDWEKRYIHEGYAESFNPDKKPIQPCPDVYWFPIASPHFTRELVEIVENYGKWSDGTNHDPRLSGGYENVPTRDIHMNQVEMESQWLFFLREYIRPLQELVFTGYYHDDPRIEGGYEAVPTRDIHMRQVGLHEAWLYFLREYVSPLQDLVFIGYLDKPPRSLMNFVVRYKPEEQPSLKPHHDSSTYTINIALNTVGVDYEGGGCRFIRYNCSVTDTKPGWMLMHPGRLTHYHEGLRVTNGTRYIMISFIDP